MKDGQGENMVKKQKKMRLPMKVAMLFVFAVALAFTSGAFMYATGDAVVDNGFTMFMVSHTEYRYAEEGQIVARLVNFQGNPIAVDNCTATILYPDKTKFVDEALMSDSVNISGDHYYEFTTPNGPEGVYEYQATCFWTSGTVKSRSVTNSFHLSSAFNSVLNNLTAIQTQIGDVNSTLYTQIDTVYNDLSDQINTNITTVLNDISSTNSTIHAKLDAMNATLSNLSINLTPVLDAIDAFEGRMATNFTAVFGEFSVVNSKLDAINLTVTDIQGTVNDMEVVLDYVNMTTSNTYDYMTGTLATNVQQILTDLGIINATVNRIESNTLEINSTVADIKQNQEDEVMMTVFSG